MEQLYSRICETDLLSNITMLPANKKPAEPWNLYVDTFKT